MTANASHEMDTPLNCIICLADKMINQTQDKEQRRMASLIKNSGSLIHFQVRSLLDRKLFQNNMLTVSYGVHNLLEVISRTITMMREVLTKNLDI
jgi:signal transduction histidine kinase